MLIMVSYLKRIFGINQAEDRVTWPDLIHRHTIALASFREWSVVSAWLRIRAQPWNPCQPRNSASASTWLCAGWTQLRRISINQVQYMVSWNLQNQTVKCNKNNQTMANKTQETETKHDYLIRGVNKAGITFRREQHMLQQLNSNAEKVTRIPETIPEFRCSWSRVFRENCQNNTSPKPS